jgi:hypothetical protein
MATMDFTTKQLMLLLLAHLLKLLCLLAIAG